MTWRDKVSACFSRLRELPQAAEFEFRTDPFGTDSVSFSDKPQIWAVLREANPEILPFGEPGDGEPPVRLRLSLIFRFPGAMPPVSPEPFFRVFRECFPGCRCVWKEPRIDARTGAAERELEVTAQTAGTGESPAPPFRIFVGDRELTHVRELEILEIREPVPVRAFGEERPRDWVFSGAAFQITVRRNIPWEEETDASAAAGPFVLKILRGETREEYSPCHVIRRGRNIGEKGRFETLRITARDVKKFE